MKKTILTAILLLTILGMNVMAGVDPACYVNVGEKTYFGQKLKIGSVVTTITSNDGTVIKVPNSKVKSCMDGTKYFERLPVVNKDYDTTQFALMEYVTSRNGFKLYFYDNPNVEPSSREFYVFDETRLCLKIDEKNAPNVFAFFGIEKR
jgi:hypothetical protein